MSWTTIHTPKPRRNSDGEEVALCRKHFLEFAKEYYNRQPSWTNPSAGTDVQQARQVSRAPTRPEVQTRPTRVQPRRAAKDKYQNARAVAQSSRKRSAEEDEASSRPAKRQKITETKYLTWPERRHELVELLCEEVEAHRGHGQCYLPPKSWICRECQLEQRKLPQYRGAIGWSYHKGTAPIANMEAIGEEFLASTARWDNWRRRLPVIHVLGDGDVSFVVDACREPVVVVF